ncbi:cation:proton antiporter [Rariglobus hedericola]|uniref:Sodium:proton exchanger n=1 Tax=Rariglobus hedericola TaxID=2597822 RepID=A0A556QRZ5_9BACT|nr:cation:proton antiporter [Rariglobus hedericola]TSJ79416.1 sodium:proton exchanger [Rariglobus hedericola]
MEDGINFIQDLAIVLLAAGLAGSLCKRIGLSVIVGYLAAGLVIGPYTPPFSFVTDVARIQTLSQVGLVFLMFAIGLGLSLTKLGRMGLPTLIATGLGAFLMLNLTQLLGVFVGWTSMQSLFIASMFVVSSSAVIAKIVSELKLTHEGAAQRALGITVMEDVVAVVMLTILASQTQSGGGDGASVGTLLATMSAFVVLLVGAGLLFVPRLLRRLEARADAELQTIIVAGVLFLLSIAAAKAGYSLALGAFLLGAIVAEMPQKVGVEKSFAGMRDLFSSVFFVSIGMMIDVRLLFGVWPLILGLFAFVMICRPIACGLAMVICGTHPREARRAGLLLTPLGEFSFIIAQLGVSSAVLPASYYPLAVGVSILTVLATPLINRNAGPLLRFAERIEPRWLTRALEAYHGWLQQAQNGKSSPLAWKLIRSRIPQIAIEMLVTSGLLIFSGQILAFIEGSFSSEWIETVRLNYIFWGVIGLIVLVMLVALWRNVTAIVMILAESLGEGTRLPASVIYNGLRAISAVLLGYWLYAILPINALPGWGWVVIGAAALVVVAIFSSRLVYWHSTWQSSVQDVLREDPDRPSGVRTEARNALDQGLEGWDMRLDDYTVPDDAAYAGNDLAQLAIPSRFGCSVIEVERNGYVITRTGPDLRIYPGDKLLLLGKDQGLAAARDFLQGTTKTVDETSDEFSGSILQTHAVPAGPHTGKTLAQLQIARETGVRVVGIHRDNTKIINPDGNQSLQSGDNLLVVGTLEELRSFRRWLRGGGETIPPFPVSA